VTSEKVFVPNESSSTRSRLDDLPLELRNMLVSFSPLAMRVVLARVPQFRIRSDDVLRARKLLCTWAAEYGYLDLLKWAHEHDFPLLQLRDGKDACKAAARGGQLAVLKWLREQKCRWDARTMWAA